VSQQIIPLDNSPNQTWQASVQINGVVVTFLVVLSYNEIAEYWVMKIYDSSQNLILSNVPLVTGLNLLRQFQYLQIGSLFLVNVTGTTLLNYPDNTDLGTDFKLVWSDNRILPVAA
jgi:hypothetical protein